MSFALFPTAVIVLNGCRVLASCTHPLPRRLMQDLDSDCIIQARHRIHCLNTLIFHGLVSQPMSLSPGENFMNVCLQQAQLRRGAGRMERRGYTRTLSETYPPSHLKHASQSSSLPFISIGILCSPNGTTRKLYNSCNVCSCRIFSGVTKIIHCCDGIKTLNVHDANNLTAILNSRINSPAFSPDVCHSMHGLLHKVVPDIGNGTSQLVTRRATWCEIDRGVQCVSPPIALKPSLPISLNPGASWPPTLFPMQR